MEALAPTESVLGKRIAEFEPENDNSVPSTNGSETHDNGSEKSENASTNGDFMADAADIFDEVEAFDESVAHADSQALVLKASNPSDSLVTANDWYADFIGKMQGMGGEMVSIKSDMITMGREVVTMRKELIGLREDIGAAGKQVDSRFDEIRQEIDRMRRVKQTNVEGLTARIWRMIPSLFNSRTGECGWVPVTFEEHNYVVVGIKQSEVILRTRFSQLSCTSKEFATALVNALPETLVFDKSSKENLKSLLLMTPFMTPNWHTANGDFSTASEKIKDAYIIVDASTWKETVLPQAMEKDYAESYTMTDGDKVEKAYANWTRIKLHQWSLLEERNNLEAYIPQLGRRLDYEEKQRMPAFLTPWWRELVNESFCEIFDIDESKPHHVAFGRVLNGGPMDDEGNPTSKPRVVTRDYSDIMSLMRRDEAGDEYLYSESITDKFVAQNRINASAFKPKKYEDSYSAPKSTKKRRN